MKLRIVQYGENDVRVEDEDGNVVEGVVSVRMEVGVDDVFPRIYLELVDTGGWSMPNPIEGEARGIPDADDWLTKV